MISEVMAGKPVIVLGAGGHGKVLIEALLLSGWEILGYTDMADTGTTELFGIHRLGDDEAVLHYPPDEVLLVNAVGALPGSGNRLELTRKMQAKGYRFAKVVHPSAVVASNVRLGAGAQVMAGSVIQPGTVVGESSIINTGTTVDHDCMIGDHCHLAPGVTLSGNVTIGQGTHIGTGACVIQGISIGQNCVIAAGSAIYRDVADNSRYIPQFRATRSPEQT